MPRRPERSGCSRSNPGEVRVPDSGKDLARPVGAEVEAEEPVAFAQACVIPDHAGFDEFVVLTLGISLVHSLSRRAHAGPLPKDHRVVRPLDPVPSRVAVHREVPPDHGTDARALRQAARQIIDKPLGRGRRNVAPVGDGVQHHFDILIRQRLHCRLDMADMPVHPAIRDHTHDMRAATRVLDRLGKLNDRRVLEKAAVFDGKVDLPQVHRHHPTRADIGVPHLGIAHLPAWQAHIRTMRDQRRMGAGCHQVIHRRRVRQLRRIRRRIVTQAPAVEDGQNDRFRGGHGCCPLLGPVLRAV